MNDAFKSLVDLHCHILPGIDDGPETLEESLAIGRLYVEAGFRTIVATPHCIPGTPWMPDVRRVREKMSLVAKGLRDAGLLLHIHSGMEIALDPLVPKLLAEGRLLTLGGGPYLLLECPFQRLPLGWEGIIGDVSRMGYRVILAHPERCAHLAEKPGLVSDIVESGALVQINWQSLTGMNGRQIKKAALAFAEERHIHCLATDAHDNSGRSPEMVRHGRAEMEALLGPGNLRRLMIDNPARVLMGGKLEDLEGEQSAPPARVRR
jgi:protein-tyrosine phosphatase